MVDEAWQQYRRGLPGAVSEAARVRLLDDYSEVMKERFDLGRHAGALPRAEEPLYRWVRYKEAFSPFLVRSLIDELYPTQGRGRGRRAMAPVVYDPMVGSGTSLLVAQERGLPALGADLMPYATFLASTMVQWRNASPDSLWQLADDVLLTAEVKSGRSRLDVPAAAWAFAPAVASKLVRLYEAVAEASPGAERELIRLALL